MSVACAFFLKPRTESGNRWIVRHRFRRHPAISPRRQRRTFERRDQSSAREIVGDERQRPERDAEAVAGGLQRQIEMIEALAGGLPFDVRRTRRVEPARPCAGPRVGVKKRRARKIGGAPDLQRLRKLRRANRNLALGEKGRADETFRPTGFAADRDVKRTLRQTRNRFVRRDETQLDAGAPRLKRGEPWQKPEPSSVSTSGKA